MSDYDCGYDIDYDHSGDDGRDHEHDLEDRPARRFRCGGPASYHGSCGGTDCESCYPGGSDEDGLEVRTSKIVKARKAHNLGMYDEVRPGDTAEVYGGFTYQPNGPRTGYTPKSYRRIAKGPAWSNSCP